MKDAQCVVDWFEVLIFLLLPEGIEPILLRGDVVRQNIVWLLSHVFLSELQGSLEPHLLHAAAVFWLSVCIVDGHVELLVSGDLLVDVLGRESLLPLIADVYHLLWMRLEKAMGAFIGIAANWELAASAKLSFEFCMFKCVNFVNVTYN